MASQLETRLACGYEAGSSPVLEGSLRRVFEQNSQEVVMT